MSGAAPAATSSTKGFLQQHAPLFAFLLLDAIDALNSWLGTPQHLDALRERDIPGLAQAARREADFNYPVPRVMSAQDCEGLLRRVLA